MEPGVKTVVYTAAIHPDNPEFQAAKEAGLPLLSRAELLGQLMKNYREAVAVAGTHGKTTTTSMLTEILLKANEDPTVSVGGMLDSIGGNVHIGRSYCFVTEACEYTNSFLSFYPTVAAVLNIHEDHLDFFKDLEDIRHSFRRFLELVPAGGTAVVYDEIPQLEKLTEGLACKIVLFGMKPESRFQAKDISYDGVGCGRFTLVDQEKGREGLIHLQVPGEHNIINALAAAALSAVLGIPFEKQKEGLEGFGGTHRRYEHKGVVKGIYIVDDYAHHPDEIRATLKAARRGKYGEIWCVFQPHTYTRTKALMKEFAETLSLADHVVLADIFPARETDSLGVSSEDICRLLKERGTDAFYFKSFEEIQGFALENCKSGDLLITMGAGDIVKVGENLLHIKSV